MVPFDANDGLFGSNIIYKQFLFHEKPFPNGNRSGIGVVIRDHRGRIVILYAGSLRWEDMRLNELYAMFFGLIRAYLDICNVVELETDNVAAEWEWNTSMTHGVVHEHAYVVQQLNERKADANLSKILMTHGVVHEHAYGVAIV
ncbi:hypothetical protein POM88_029308 [Heracleum sosnowskyi]|uniref:RNase H type-1 domain-containing protein n=1 Tax=Heracleum sosnowskyi TaxID=360622 RepID=A0AAD8HTM9_9APIA|nr:hypothetical protein POM88_029308 [Heracleum sosnowskyi]